MTDPTRLSRPAASGSALMAAYLGATRMLDALGPSILRRRLRDGKEDPERWTEKLGHATLSRPVGPLIWLHAVSVGEGLSVLPLLKALVRARQDMTVLLTCTTVTAAGLLRDRVPERVLLQYLPLDLAGPIGRFLDHWRPDVAVMVESEFWPRLVHDVHARGIPLILANARLSERSERRWGRLPGLARAILSRFTVLTAPDAGMAERLQAIGADPARLCVTGTLKRGAERLPVDLSERARLQAALGQRPVWCAASTHPGEDEVVATAHRALLERLPGTLCLLAPRHPARGDEVVALLSAQGLAVTRRSAGDLPGGDVFLADTLGEMGLWFELAPVTLVAGSMVEGIGGHNAYEPALHGSAILHGPWVGNFADLYARLDAAGAARTVADTGELAAELANLLDAPDAALRMTKAARDVLAAEGDGVAAVADLILGQLA